MNFVFAGVPFLLTALVGAALAVLVFAHGPGKGPNRSLATLLLVTAAAAFSNAMASFSQADADTYTASAWSRTAQAIGTVGYLAAVPLALSWPATRRWAPRAAANLWPFMTVGLALASLDVAQDVHGIFGSSSSVFSLRGLWRMVGHAILIFGGLPALLLAYEARSEASRPIRDGRILMALGLGLFYFYLATRDLVFLGADLQNVAESGAIYWVDVISTGLRTLWVCVYVAFLLRLVPTGAARTARGLLIACAASGAIDSLLYYARNDWGIPFAPDYESRLFLFAVWTLLPIVLMAYVVLRGQIPGIDVKVRFALSKSTIAAVFIAVFFVASEVAQQFFSEKTSSTYIGIGIAGTLVFAMAPIQRMAERLAQKAVPLADGSTSVVHERSRPGADTYRRAVRLALKDRTLTNDEEIELSVVAHDLGLSAPEATRIRLEVEREQGAVSRPRAARGTR